MTESSFSIWPREISYFAFYCYDKQYDHNPLGDRTIYFTLQLLAQHKRKSVQGLNEKPGDRDHGRILLIVVLPMVCSLSFLLFFSISFFIPPGHPDQCGIVPAFIHHYSTKCPTDLSTGNLMKTFSQMIFSHSRCFQFVLS